MVGRDYPRWDLSRVYPGLQSEEFDLAQANLERMIEQLEEMAETFPTPAGDRSAPNMQKLCQVVGAFLRLLNKAEDLFQTLSNYVRSFVDTDTYNENAQRILSALELLQVRLDLLRDVKFTAWMGTLTDILPTILEADPVVRKHSFFLAEAAAQSNHFMPAPYEQLAGELSLSGALAWSRLQAEITSQLSWKILDEEDQEREFPITSIINLVMHPDEKMRRRGYEAEMEAWKTVETPLAAALNGVKGTQLTLFAHRNRQDHLHDSLDKNRIDRITLEIMLNAVKGALPMCREFLKSKAKRFGKVVLPWWDLPAVTIKTKQDYPYEHAQRLIEDTFSSFSEELAGLARAAFKENWIDVPPRPGKVPNAYCMYLPLVEESRILLNYGDNLNWLLVLAHELGHAFHNHCLEGRTSLQRKIPPTLAETASIFCETIVTNATVEQASTIEEQFAILEASLNNSVQSIIDMYALYMFEDEVFTRRAKAQLPANELNAIMEWAQAEVYGEALDENYRCKYRWTWLPHFYIPELSFYNYPYTFGLLFGTGLYAVYRQRGDAFVSQYKELLSSTGMATAADLARSFGMDIRASEFWQTSLEVIGERIRNYVDLAQRIPLASSNSS